MIHDHMTCLLSTFRRRPGRATPLTWISFQVLSSGDSVDSRNQSTGSRNSCTEALVGKAATAPPGTVVSFPQKLGGCVSKPPPHVQERRSGAISQGNTLGESDKPLPPTPYQVESLGGSCVKATAAHPRKSFRSDLARKHAWRIRQTASSTASRMWKARADRASKTPPPVHERHPGARPRGNVLDESAKPAPHRRPHKEEIPGGPCVIAAAARPRPASWSAPARNPAPMNPPNRLPAATRAESPSWSTGKTARPTIPRGGPKGDAGPWRRTAVPSIKPSTSGAAQRSREACRRRFRGRCRRSADRCRDLRPNRSDDPATAPRAAAGIPASTSARPS